MYLDNLWNEDQEPPHDHNEEEQEQQEQETRGEEREKGQEDSEVEAENEGEDGIKSRGEGTMNHDGNEVLFFNNLELMLTLSTLTDCRRAQGGRREEEVHACL